MTSFKRWLGAGAIVLVALAMIACEPTTDNRDPVASFVPDMTLTVDGTSSLTLSRIFSDNEGDKLMYTATSDKTEYVTVSKPDSNSRITIKAVKVGSAKITLTAADGVSGNSAATTDFTVTVDDKPTDPVDPPDNNAPRPKAGMILPDLTDLKVKGSAEVELADYFTDDDGDAITYTADPAPAGVVTTSVSGALLTITVVAPGTATITVTATDAHNLSIKESFDVTVINQAPMTTGEGLTSLGPLQVNTSFQPFDAKIYFSDPEGDGLTYSASSSDKNVATASVSGSTITVTAGAVAGTATITLSATDNKSNGGVMNPSATQDLTVTVSAVPNEKPVVSTEISDQSLQLVVNATSMTESATTTIDLADHFSDSDNAPKALEYSADSDWATIDGSMLTITADDGDANTTTTITVTASDGAAQVSDMFDVTVTSPDKPTSASELPDQNFDHDDMEPRTFTLSEYFSGATTYAVSITTGEDYVTAEEDGGVLTLTPVDSGRAVVKVTPSNSGGNGPSQTITVIVDSPPAPTWKKPLQVQTIVSDADPTPITLSDYFSGATSYAVGSNNEAALTVGVADGVLTLTPHKHGVAMVTVTPSNSAGNAGPAQTFNVTVQAKPMLKSGSTLGDMRIVRPADGEDIGSRLADLSTLFEDPDGIDSSLTYNTETGDVKKVYVIVQAETGNDVIPTTDSERDKKVSAKGAKVTIVGRAEGSAKITVTVTDSDGLTAVETFTVAVVTANTPPSASGEQPAGYTGANRLKVGDAPKKWIDNKNISTYFQDTDMTASRGDKLTFTVKYVTTDSGAITDNKFSNETKVDDPVATAVVSPDEWDGDTPGSSDKFTITVTPKKAGSAHDIVIIATDLAGTQAIRRIAVQVNHRPVAEGAGTAKLKLGSVTAYSDLSVGDVGTGSDTAVPNLTLVSDNSGYFADEDTGEPTSCNFILRGDNVFGTDMPDIVGDGKVLQLAGTDASGAIKKRGTAYLDISCTDGFERSPTATLTVKVNYDGSIR